MSTVSIYKAPRRSQSQRLAETRARILAATTVCIHDCGFHHTSLQKVARQAGVTVGAVQHHFASKAELLAAVVEDGFKSLSFNLEEAQSAGGTLEERIALFVEQSWQHCNSPAYQSNLHILLGMRNEAEANFEQWLQQSLGHLITQGFNLWRRMFHDVKLSESEHLNILLYCFSSLSGIALLSRISQMQERVDNDLLELKKLLLLRFTAYKKTMHE